MGRTWMQTAVELLSKAIKATSDSTISGFQLILVTTIVQTKLI